jgi:hypothetical protein
MEAAAKTSTGEAIAPTYLHSSFRSFVPLPLVSKPACSFPQIKLLIVLLIALPYH